ncbi:MAG: hypothetical protein JO270_25375 [Acidobacteriaceae bacterium]|nr:hypothetical protein [Acidobacteriaceae bacterium]MBV8570468.1 hypothetical protein [Acidobacteriaceae bacterium]
MKRHFTVAANVIGAAFILMTPLQASGQAAFVVDHFTSVHAATQSYTFVNFEEHGLSEFRCANIYVFSDEGPIACGGCFVSPNGTRTVPLTDLIRNPIRGVVPKTGVIKVIYSRLSFSFPAIDYCDATHSVPTIGLKTFRQKGAYELELFDTPVSKNELAELNQICADIEDVGGFGQGIITCPPTAELPPARSH